MSNVFKNPLVIAETVVGSIIDTRALVLYEQPEKLKMPSAEITLETDLLDLVDKRQLKELFTGFEVPYVSKINGMNIYGISYISAETTLTSDLCDHPIETGSIITDNAIIQPISMKINVAMPTAFATRIYDEMVRKYYQTKKYICVQTKYALYRNMVIETLAYKLENESVDRPIMEMTLRQIMEVEAQYITTEDIIEAPANAEDTNTKDLGRKVGSVVGERYGVVE